MRIIAGEYRGRALLPPDTDATRPITDRVKQSLFDILSPRIEGAAVYDLFAGTGSMGLECLSRGAGHVTFFEADRSALQRLRQNIEALRMNPERFTVVGGDLFRWFRRESGTGMANLVFLDPPYRYLAENAANLQQLGQSIAGRYLASGGAVVFRHGSYAELQLPGLTCLDRREYGSMTIELLGKSPSG